MAANLKELAGRDEQLLDQGGKAKRVVEAGRPISMQLATNQIFLRLSRASTRETTSRTCTGRWRTSLPGTWRAGVIAESTTRTATFCDRVSSIFCAFGSSNSTPSSTILDGTTPRMRTSSKSPVASMPSAMMPASRSSARTMVRNVQSDEITNTTGIFACFFLTLSLELYGTRLVLPAISTPSLGQPH